MLCRSCVELSKEPALEAAQRGQIRTRFGVPFCPTVSGERVLSTEDWAGSNSGRVKRHPKTEYFCVFTQLRPLAVIRIAVTRRAVLKVQRPFADACCLAAYRSCFDNAVNGATTGGSFFRESSLRFSGGGRLTAWHMSKGKPRVRDALHPVEATGEHRRAFNPLPRWLHPCSMPRSRASSRRASAAPPSRITASWFHWKTGRNNGASAFIHARFVRTHQS
ncbi:hypothetical protein P3T22_000306 [Paraburkholderia sp. GAS348]